MPSSLDENYGYSEKELLSDTAAVVLQEGQRLSTSGAAVADGARGNTGGLILRGEVQ